METENAPRITRIARGALGVLCKHWETAEIRRGMSLPIAHLGEVATQLPDERLKQAKLEFEQIQAHLASVESQELYEEKD